MWHGWGLRKCIFVVASILVPYWGKSQCLQAMLLLLALNSTWDLFESTRCWKFFYTQYTLFFFLAIDLCDTKPNSTYLSLLTIFCFFSTSSTFLYSRQTLITNDIIFLVYNIILIINIILILKKFFSTVSFKNKNWAKIVKWPSKSKTTTKKYYQ